MSITDFLLARIAEDEAVARAAIDAPSGGGGTWRNTFRQIEGVGHVEIGDVASSWYADHIARHDPARVIAECAAKRAIVEAHEAYAQESIESTGIAFVGARVGQQATGDILRTLAAVYADHDEYQDSWKVGA